jgi:hypothetical protein
MQSAISNCANGGTEVVWDIHVDTGIDLREERALTLR